MEKKRIKKCTNPKGRLRLHFLAFLKCLKSALLLSAFSKLKKFSYLKGLKNA
jgi:hypothetical protein